MPSLTIYQPYFDESQIKQIDYIPYYNENCNYFFENQVILDLINSNAHKESDYFGVLSYKFKEKITDRTKQNWDALPNYKNHQRILMYPEQIEKAFSLFEPPILSLMQHPAHDPISYAEKFHKGFIAHFSKIMKKIDFDWQPKIFSNTYYSNYFIARSDIYEDYVKKMLAPAMQVMREMPELSLNSGYAFDLPERLQKEWGFKYYPFHPFILERLFSYYCDINKSTIWK